MEKKYELTNETIEFREHTLHRIIALKDFSNVHTGDIGGFIEKEENLSQSDTCWVYENAKVYDDAVISGNAAVSGNASVFRNAMVFGNSTVYENSWVYGNAMVYGNVVISENAKILGNAKVFGNAVVSGNASIFDRAKVSRYSKVSGHAKVFGNAEICDYAEICDHALVSDHVRITGKSVICDHAQVLGESIIIDAEIKEQWRINNAVVDHCVNNLEELIRIQTGLIPVCGKVIAYKQVKKDLTSFYDPKFQYVIGEYAEACDSLISKDSCASGLHFSNANYWNWHNMPSGSVFLVAEINLEDIITVQQGKIRCKRALILGKYEVK